ncbi:hypothetical protein V7S54_31630 [Ensifer sp. CCNWLY38]
MRLELKPLKDAVQLGGVVRVLRADEEVDVDEAGLGGDVETQFDVREDELHIGQSAGQLVLEDFLVSVCKIVIRDRDCFDFRRRGLKRGEVGFPGRATAELIVEDGPWRMDVGFPATPFRSPTDHISPYVTAGRCPS